MVTDIEKIYKKANRRNKYSIENLKTKHRIIRCEDVDDVKISSILTLMFNKRTGTISISPFGVRTNAEINGKHVFQSISPAKNQKIKGNIQHALEVLRKDQQFTIKYHKERTETIVFQDKVELNALTYERIIFNKVTGTVGFNFGWMKMHPKRASRPDHTGLLYNGIFAPCTGCPDRDCIPATCIKLLGWVLLPEESVRTTDSPIALS